MAVSMIRTALGVSQSKTAQSSWDIQAGMEVCANATLLVHLAHDAASVTNVTWNALPLTLNVSALVAGQAEGSIWSLLSNPTSATGILSVSWTGVNVTAKAAAATQVMGINTFVSGVGNASAGVSVVSGGSTALISTTHYLTAAIGTEGVSTATVFTWSADITTTGQRNGTSGGGAATNMTIQEGFAVSQAASTRSARATGAVATDQVLVMAAYTNIDADILVVASAAQMQWRTPAIAEALPTNTRIVLHPRRRLFCAATQVTPTAVYADRGAAGWGSLCAEGHTQAPLSPI